MSVYVYLTYDKIKIYLLNKPIVCEYTGILYT